MVPARPEGITDELSEVFLFFFQRHTLSENDTINVILAQSVDVIPSWLLASLPRL